MGERTSAQLGGMMKLRWIARDIMFVILHPHRHDWSEWRYIFEGEWLCFCKYNGCPAHRYRVEH